MNADEMLAFKKERLGPVDPEEWIGPFPSETKPAYPGIYRVFNQFTDESQRADRSDVNLAKSTLWSRWDGLLWFAVCMHFDEAKAAKTASHFQGRSWFGQQIPPDAFVLTSHKSKGSA